MALYQVNAGDRILAADINQFYSLLKGVAASGETVALIYNAAGALQLQPSSNPAAGTELFQIKNAAGTVQSALSSDGKAYLADGVVGTPSVAFESEKTSGLYRISAGVIGISILGVEEARITASGISIDGGATFLGGFTGIASNVTPDADNTRDVGATATRWRDVFAGTSIRIGTNPASAGGIRIANATAIVWRNAANSGDVTGIQVTSGDVLELRGGVVKIGTDYASVGATPAASGAVRLPWATYITFRRSDNLADVTALSVGGEAGDRVVVGNSGQELRLVALANSIDIRYASIALGGGSSATLGTIGGSGPATAGQNAWLQVLVNGSARWIPIWA